jgi:hypothetical protein
MLIEESGDKQAQAMAEAVTGSLSELSKISGFQLISHNRPVAYAKTQSTRDCFSDACRLCSEGSRRGQEHGAG